MLTSDAQYCCVLTDNGSPQRVRQRQTNCGKQTEYIRHQIVYTVTFTHSPLLNSLLMSFFSPCEANQLTTACYGFIISYVVTIVVTAFLVRIGCNSWQSVCSRISVWWIQHAPEQAL